MKVSQILPIFLTGVIACPGLQRRDAPSNISAVPPIATRIKPAVPTTRIAITNVRVFDGYQIREPSTVFVDGVTISKHLDVVDSVVEGNGGILLPGLIDGHCHPATVDHLAQLSSYGVTTAFLMNCINYESCSSLRDQTGLTSLFMAGMSAQGPGSAHARNGHTPASQLISSPQQAPQYVANVFGNGSDFLKIVSELNGPDQDTQNALVLYAHNIGKKVMTHASDIVHYVMAVKSKANGPQHLPVDAVLDNATLAEIRANGQFATPTLAVFWRVFHTPGAAATLGENSTSYEKNWPILKQNVRALKNAGIPVVAGTDATPPYAGLQIPFGTTLHDEMYYLVEAGFKPVDALRAATLMPVLSHGIADRGRIEPGLRADLVLLQPDAEPLKSINDTRKIARVWNGGLEFLNVTTS
ncbi:hypothetical protein AMS68_006517 [Peltaster fructicola]|uniref:Amidohydrolase-related domain-containing protein n=1 Tax=Peltaster fructicola TaxID=286661 RepID=A0A6H0Y2Y3_9PEZI|nr:hypothetical protein AMS68_006517 [Peltaster fructicola]